MSIYALIPARLGSRGVPNKNFRQLPDGSGPRHCFDRALFCAVDAGCEPIASTDAPKDVTGDWDEAKVWIDRPLELCQDDTPMIDVVKHALAAVPGEPDDIWVLLQPTQPLRKPSHVTDAIARLRHSNADSVVSVVKLPRTHHPKFVLRVGANNELKPWLTDLDIDTQPSRRQEVSPVCIRDGTVYAFRRRTVTERGTIYGLNVQALVIDPSETCALDTPADWDALVARIRNA